MKIRLNGLDTEIETNDPLAVQLAELYNAQYDMTRKTADMLEDSLEHCNTLLQIIKTGKTPEPKLFS